MIQNFLRSRRASSEVGRRRPVHADEAASSSEADGPLQPKKREGNKDMTKVLYFDKDLGTGLQNKYLSGLSTRSNSNVLVDNIAI